MFKRMMFSLAVLLLILGSILLTAEDKTKREVIETSVHTSQEVEALAVMEQQEHVLQRELDLDEGRLAAHRYKKLKEIATYFGIETEGKTVDELRHEVDAAKAIQKEKWEQFKADHRSKRLEMLRSKAQSKGINVEGMSEHDLRKELHKLKKPCDDKKQEAGKE